MCFSAYVCVLGGYMEKENSGPASLLTRLNHNMAHQFLSAFIFQLAKNRRDTQEVCRL